MFGLGAATRVYLAVGATDLRKGFEGLFGLVKDRLGLEPLSGHVVCFCNRSRSRIKGIVLGRERAVGLQQTAGKGALRLALGAR